MTGGSRARAPETCIEGGAAAVHFALGQTTQAVAAQGVDKKMIAFRDNRHRTGVSVIELA
ncbi:hypothetical protein D3874_25135 [Oleomonas cavernae]|uniref:Uncharacterized protein n=1 Tax=Oleomonas cavernae TaxID=2320859 RepID=A0A418VZH3_9PROT|nr:hypothetical protein D3874_25135 [Oleomonas cavernae]